MCKARDLADELDRLRENLQELELHTVSSPKMDGMPKGSTAGDAVGGQVARADSLREKIQRVEKALGKARSAGRKALQGVRAPIRMFCEVYFLENRPLDAACGYARIDKRTGERYRAEVYKY